MRSPISLFALALVASACTPPPALDGDDTDTDSEDLSLADAIDRAFLDFEGGDDAVELAAIIEAIEAGLTTEGVDLDGEVAQRQYTLADPDNPDLEGRGIQPRAGDRAELPDGTDPADQIGVVTFGRSRQTFATNVETLLETNQVCIESDTTVYYARTYTEGTASDFQAGTIDLLRSTNEVRKELSFLAAGWYDLFKDFRRIELSDGREGVVARSWISEVYEGDGGGTFYQTFTAEAWIDDGEGGAMRMYAFWGQIDIGLGNGAMRDLIADSLEEGFVRGDNFADDEDVTDYCAEPRDRPYTRAEDTAE